MSARAELHPAVAGAKANKAVRHLPERVCLGRVSGARGLKGEVRIRAFTARPRDIAAYGPVSDASGDRSFAVSVVADIAGGVVARLSGIADRTAAERLKGLELFVPRAALPQLPAGEFYQDDLVGLAAEDAKGRPLGRVRAIHDFGAGTILELEAAGAERGKARTELWPAGAVASVDLNAGKLVLEQREEIVAEEMPRRGSRKAGTP